jgi:serine/threonine protein kinase
MAPLENTDRLKNTDRNAKAMCKTHNPLAARRYVLGSVLGAGSFGVVREATEKKSQRKYAVKTIPKSPKNAKSTPRCVRPALTCPPAACSCSSSPTNLARLFHAWVPHMFGWELGVRVCGAG